MNEMSSQGVLKVLTNSATSTRTCKQYSNEVVQDIEE